MKNIARIVATAALTAAAVLTAGAAAHADGDAIDWPVAPASAGAPAAPATGPATALIDWP
ncbi:hypothetical protein PV721_35620 [Streptomyces sp. MB09-01]|uniref:hypothetical protein n=1 Tax=Streptomyces sp. MB09-01 TaxID=3028666 RepID=UPI0029B5DA78|nr:hypothetical protein [Streptomyces sp. MB09-01]MDX3539564.1 hypothetical protein [Streptomyces sp. MB09-01]